MLETEKRKEITHPSQLVEYFGQGCKPPGQWRIGTEHEEFLFYKSNLKRLPYKGNPGICSLLDEMQKDGWQPVLEKEKIIGLKRNGASISFEPGGQLEFSGKKMKTVTETFLETKQYNDRLDGLCEKLGFFRLPMGVDPISLLENTPWVPKERYAWMRRHMPFKGKLGLEMMANTASVQVNLDYGSESDMIKKMRIAQALQPVITAIFAHSPFSRGKPNGFLSYRAHIWNHTDPDRCGFLPFIFDKGFGFEQWVDFLLDVPMYFILRDESYFPANGMTFRDFLRGKHRFQPTMGDWETHVSTVFPDLRLRQFIEMRGADAGCTAHVAAVPALWVGLLYDDNSREEVHELIAPWDVQTIREMRARVPEKGLQAASGSMHAGKIARQICRIAQEGLRRRAENLGIASESRFLKPVQEIIETGITQAEKLLQLHDNERIKNMSALIRHWKQIQKQNCPDEPAG